MKGARSAPGAGEPTNERNTGHIRLPGAEYDKAPEGRISEIF